MAIGQQIYPGVHSDLDSLVAYSIAVVVPYIVAAEMKNVAAEQRTAAAEKCTGVAAVEYEACRHKVSQVAAELDTGETVESYTP